MSGAGNALLLAGTALLAGSAVFLFSVELGKGEPSSPRTAERLAGKIRVTRVVLVLSAVAACAGWWLGV